MPLVWPSSWRMVIRAARGIVGQEPRQAVVEADAALRDELHHDGGHERLGDARDAEHGVGVDGVARATAAGRR